MNSDKIDLNEIASRPDHQLSIVPREDPDERAARLRIEEAEAAHKRRKDTALHGLSFIVIGVALWLCVRAIIKDGATAEDARWAVPLLTAIVTGLVGYITGRASK
jgi:VIT1/CCC1 family predicted Fe2+/Mn2+ transporter